MRFYILAFFLTSFVFFLFMYVFLLCILNCSFYSGAAWDVPTSQPHVPPLHIIQSVVPWLIPQPGLLSFYQHSALSHHHPALGEAVRFHAACHPSLHGGHQRLQRPPYGLGKTVSHTETPTHTSLCLFIKNDYSFCLLIIACGVWRPRPGSGSVCWWPHHACEWRVCAWAGSYRSGGAHSEGTGAWKEHLLHVAELFK